LQAHSPAHQCRLGGENGRKRIYQLAPSGGKAVPDPIEQLAELERFWELALEAFKRYAEKKK
jgi:hypothetical protein